MRRLLLLLAAGLLWGGLSPARAAGPTALAKTEHVEAELVAETDGAAPGSVIYVALHQKLTPGWHTYWRNPGDAGQATSLAWTLPAGWKAGDIVWPTPERYVSGPLMNYVFSKEVYLPTAIQVPASARPGERVRLVATADWLVCKDVCVPEGASLSLDVPIVSAPRSLAGKGAMVRAAVERAPKPVGLKASFQETKSYEILLSVTGAAVKGRDAQHAYFYPYNGAVIEHAKPQKAARGPEGLTLTLPAGYLFVHKKAPPRLEGVLDLGGGSAFEVSASAGAPQAGATGLTPPTVVTEGSAPTGGAGGGGDALSIPAAFGFALLGGLILNLMPCVFPILSLKAAALARHLEDPARARAEAIAFSLGCVLTFMALAGALIAVQAAGEAVGWGFQLQSPLVVAILTLVMLGVGLNLSGVFEVGASAQGLGQSAAARGGLIGAFATGALAVVVAAPCTAPFMAPAIGWALVQSPLVALLIFAGLGLGLALPFAAIAFLPALQRLLPRPGAWMDVLRKILAFPMYGAAGWLTWVFALEAGDGALPYLFGAAVALAFAAFLFGLSQSGARPWLSRSIALVSLLAAAPLIAVGAAGTAAAGAASAASSAVGPGLTAEPWSPEKVEALKSQGKPVFVDFTAAWCVTCQVNEKTALATPEVIDAFHKTGAVYLKADWTNRNPDIAKALAALGRQGVPLYLLYDGRSPEPRILPQLLTAGSVVEALTTAKS